MDQCLFCKIVAKKIPSKLIFEDENVIAFHDINPQAPFHALIIPKKHIDKIASLEDADGPLAGTMLLAARKIALDQSLSDYRLVFNNGEQAGQSVFHIHLHLLAGRKMSWPPG